MTKQSVTVFGIKQCDTVRKALRWLDENKIEHKFHDLRVDGFNSEMLRQWLKSTDLATLVNRRSTSWRQLSQQSKDNSNTKHLSNLLIATPTLVKRPVFVRSGQVLAVGFTAATKEVLANV